MCRPHWFAVPSRLKKIIYETVHDPDRRAEYRSAVSDAVAWVNDRKAAVSA
jgi:hypothetical protein